MAYEQSTAGIIVKYAVESTAGTIPSASTSYTTIPNVKSIPEMNASPNTIDVTDLSETEYKKYIFGLKDLGGDLAFGVNMTTDLKSKWDALVTAADTAWAAGKSTWFEVVIPGWTDGFFFAGRPAPIGMVAAEVDAALEGEVHIAPVQVKGWATKI